MVIELVVYMGSLVVGLGWLCSVLSGLFSEGFAVLVVIGARWPVVFGLVVFGVVSVFFAGGGVDPE